MSTFGFFLVRIFPPSDQISIICPNAEKYWLENNLNLDTFYAVQSPLSSIKLLQWSVFFNSSWNVNIHEMRMWIIKYKVIKSFQVSRGKLWKSTLQNNLMPLRRFKGDRFLYWRKNIWIRVILSYNKKMSQFFFLRN